MALSGTLVCVIKLTTDVVAIACCILRWYILRKQNRQTFMSLLSHGLFALAILCEVTATIQSSIVLLEGDKIINGQGMQMGLMYLVNERTLRITFFAHLMYYLSECILKAAFLAFYADLYSRVQTTRKYAIWVATGVWITSYVAAFLMLFTYCLPFEQNWRPDGTNAHCPVLFNVPTFFVLAGANIISDIAILIVPLLVIGAMRLGRKEKVSLALVFSIGMISIAASVIRCGIVGDRFITANHTWDTVWVWMLWSHAEMFFGVLAFTLPSFRYILLRGITKVQGSSRKYSNKLSANKWSENASSMEMGSQAARSRIDRKGGGGGVGEGVLVETTVTLREESSSDRESVERKRAEASESQTELTKTAESLAEQHEGKPGSGLDSRDHHSAGLEGSQGYEWRIDRDTHGRRDLM